MDMENKRQSDLLIGELIGQFEAFREQQSERDRKQEKRDADAQAWREKFDTRLQPLEAMAALINKPYKATLWAIGIVLTALMTKFAFSVVHWFQRHWQ